jgi:hypothetical protein
MAVVLQHILGHQSLQAAAGQTNSSRVPGAVEAWPAEAL